MLLLPGGQQTHVNAVCMLSLCQQMTFVPSEFQQCHAAAVHLKVGVVIIVNAERSPFKMHLDMHRRSQGRQAWSESGLPSMHWGLSPKLNMRHLDASPSKT